MRLENNGVVSSSSNSATIPGVNMSHISNGSVVGRSVSSLKQNGSGSSDSHSSNGNSNLGGGRNGSLGKLAAGGFGVMNESAETLVDHVRPRPTGDYFGHDREEMVRLMIQALVDLGYRDAASRLEGESGFILESQPVANFRQAVLRGQWDKAESLAYEMEIQEKTNLMGLLFCLREQKFLELLEAGEDSRALVVLRKELEPLGYDVPRLHFLSGLVLCTTGADLKQKAGWDGAAGLSRQQLLTDLSAFISPAIMLPEHRFAKLLHQAKQTQIAGCVYHNASNKPSLYTDHKCDRDQFPRVIGRTLTEHTDEVYCVKFSSDGRRLLSVSNDARIIIWDVETWQPIFDLSGHTKAVTYADWSPDDSRIVSCSRDNTAKMWNTQTGKCIATMNSFSNVVSSVAWHPDGQSFVLSSMDTSLILYSAQSCQILRKITTSSRFYDVKITPDARYLVGVCNESMLHVFDMEDLSVARKYGLGSWSTCIQVSADSRHVLINTGAREVQLVDIETGEVKCRYPGQVQDRWVIRGCFGGEGEHFVLSGSEDSFIYVWFKRDGQLVEQLAGHTGGVNCVAWNPKNPNMFVSCSDDKTIKIWETPHAQSQQQQRNGMAVLNGKGKEKVVSGGMGNGFGS